MTVVNANIHPIDTEVLEKGDYITPEQIEDILGVSRNDKQYPFKLMYLQKKIMMDRQDIYAKAEKDGLRILTDAEWTNYEGGLFTNALRAMARSVRRIAAVDVRELTEDERTKHDRRQIVMAQTLQGAHSSRREAMKSLPHERSVPGLIESSA